MFFARFFLIASAVGGALAQISNVSTQCQSTVLAVAASPGAACLNPNGLVQVFLQGSSNSAVSPIDTWLKGLCALGPCSNVNIASVVTNVTTGCATELKPFLGDAQPGALAPLIVAVYPTIRKGVCLADASNNNQLCVTQTLSNIEAVNGTLTTNKLLNILSAIAHGDDSSLSGVNICTPCVKQIYNVAKNDFPAIFGQGDIATDMRARCGSSFVDSASDPNIIQTASNSTSPATTSSAADCVQITGQQALLSAFLLGFLALAA